MSECLKVKYYRGHKFGAMFCVHRIMLTWRRHFAAGHFAAGHFAAGHFAAGHFAAGHFAAGYFAARTFRRQTFRRWKFRRVVISSIGHFADRKISSGNFV